MKRKTLFIGLILIFLPVIANVFCNTSIVYAATCYSCGQTLEYDYSNWTYWGPTVHMRLKECANCSAGISNSQEFGNHRFSYTGNGDGTHTKRCTICGWSTSESHTYGSWKYINSSQHRKDCTVCSGYMLQNHKVTSVATCTTAAYCGSCKSYYGNVLGHITPATFTTTTTQHWKLCSRGCGAYVYVKENHNDSDNNGYCDVCNYLMDLIPPEISFSVNSNLTVAKSHSTVVTVTDAGGSGLATCKYIWTTSSAAPTVESDFTSSFTTGDTIQTPTVSGTYYLHIYAKDGSDNYTIKSSGGFALDNTAPVGTIKINNGESYTTSNSVILNVSASEDTSQMAISDTTTKGTYETYNTTKEWDLTEDEGTKTVYIWFKDSIGNESVMYADTIILDLNVPNLGTLTLTPTTTTITATVTGATDAVSGIKNYDYYKDGTLTATAKGATYTYTSLTPNTKYNITYLVRDNVDRVSSISSAQYKYTLATIPSDLTASDGTSANSITVTWNANSNPSGTKYVVEYTADGTIWSVLTSTAITSTTYTHTGLSANTTYQYRVKAINEENISTPYSAATTGRTTQKITSDNIILDLEAPVATFTMNKTNDIEKSITVNIDEVYEIASLKYHWTTSTTKLTAESSFTHGTFTSGQAIFPPDTLDKGNYYLQIYAEDAAGNSEVYVSTIFRNYPEVDVTKSSILINNGKLCTNTQNVTLTLSSNSAEYMFLTESAVAGGAITSSQWIAYATSKDFTLSTGDGEKIVYAYYKDIFGNIVNVSDTIILDTIAPGIGDMTGIQYKNTTSGGTASVSASGFDDYGGSGIKNVAWVYRIDDGSWSTVSLKGTTATSDTYAMPVTTEGTYTVRMYLYDAAGNEAYKDTTVVIDRTAPKIGFITPNQKANYAEGTEIVIEAKELTDNENGSGIDKITYQYKLDDGSWSTATTEQLTINSSEYRFNIEGDGIYTVKATLYDNAGNTVESETTIQIDHTPPTLGTLTATATISTITVTVTDATDNIEVGGYEFYIDGIFAGKQESNVFTFQNLNPSSPYEITYKVYDSFGNYTEMSSITIKYTLANAPIDLVASDDMSPTKILVEWSSNDNGADTIYELIVSDDQTVWSDPIYTGTATQFTHADLPFDTIKYYKVRAKNQEGIYTEYSNIDQGETIDDVASPVAYISARENITLGIEGFAKKTDDVRMVITLYDESFKSSSLTKEDIKVYIETDEIVPTRKEIESITEVQDGLEISLLLNGLINDGDIKLYIPAGKIEDDIGNTNEALYLVSDMKADNTIPKLTVNARPVDSSCDEYILEITRKDENGIGSFTINDEEVEFSGDSIEYLVSENGTYKIVVKDPALNENSNEQIITGIEAGKTLIMIWNIPANANASGSGTTVTLPIPSNTFNDYTVVWGDGISESYTKEAFPTHTYTNETETEYTIKIKGTVNSLGYYNTIEPTESNIYSEYYTFTEYLKSIQKWGKINATRFGFAYCDDLQGTLPEPTGFEKLISTENMFRNCTSLTEPIASNFLETATEITSVKNMFMNCTSLTGEIPADLFANNTKITTFENAFANCTSLTGNIPDALFANATIAENFAGTFKGCTSLEGVIPENLFANSTVAKTFCETFANCTSLVSLEADANGVVTAVPTNLFINNRFVLNYYRTFYNCSSLTGIVNSDIFASNEVIHSISEDSLLKSNYTGTFENCTSIESVNLDSSVVGHQMFKDCASIKDININNVVDIGTEAFYGCNVLDNITISNNNLISIGTDAFEYTGADPDKLFTYINRENEMLLNYDWEADNRIIDVEAPKGRVEIVTEKYPFTNTEEVELKITLIDDTLPENCEIAILNEDDYNKFIANDNQDYNSLLWDAYKENENWTLTANDGIKTVYVLFRDQYGNVSEIKKALY